MKPNSAKRFKRPYAATRSLAHVLFELIAMSGVLSAHAANNPILYNLIIPESGTGTGSEITVELVALNRAAEPIVVTFPDTLTACLHNAEVTACVELDAEADSRTQQLEAGTFRLHRYTFNLPGNFPQGQTVIELKLSEAGKLQTLLDIPKHDEATEKRTHEEERVASSTTLPDSRTLTPSPQNTPLGRLSPYEPIYFVYGHDAPAAKFQFSLKYRLMDFGISDEWQTTRTLQFGFTQRSLWDVKGPSSPFYDTSYMPEIFYEIRPLDPEHGKGFSWLGMQTAYKHESNGRDGDASRTTNIAYIRSSFAFGDLSKWHLLLIPELQIFVSSFDDVPGLRDYRGYGRLMIVVERNDGPGITTTLWAGTDFKHPSMQVDLTIPVHARFLDFGTCFLVQYFNGYGESILSYQEQSETIRAGIELLR